MIEKSDSNEMLNNMNEKSVSGDLTPDALNAIQGNSLSDQELIIRDYMTYLEKLNKNKATLLEQNNMDGLKTTNEEIKKINDLLLKELRIKHNKNTGF